MNFYAIKTAIDPDDEDDDPEVWSVVAGDERRARKLVKCRSVEDGQDLVVLKITWLFGGVLCHPEGVRRCGTEHWT